MSIEISREIEARLAAEARRQGISVDALLARLIKENVVMADPVRSGSDLPVWHLGEVATLHRRDIYDDAR